MKKVNILIIAAILMFLGFSSCDNDTDVDVTYSSEMWYSSGYLNLSDSIFHMDDSTAICFMSLSKNALSHSWTVSDNSKFLDGNLDLDETTDFEPFVVETLPEDYILNDDSTINTTDKKITLYFPNIGDYTVKIHDVFADSVFYKSSIGDMGSVKDSITGNYVFDYTFKIKVTVPEPDSISE